MTFGPFDSSTLRATGTVCCPCDELKHPVKPDIRAGLSALPRQLAGFPEYRLAMLRDIPTYAPLAEWRAREGDDLGILLLEMWAYVLDTLAFYDERIANESYLRTALLHPSIRKLTGLIGYQPRPALAASVVLAAIADGVKAVKLPLRTGFRSDAFDGEPPQVFETEVEHTIHPLKNQWVLAAVRERLPGEEILLEPGTAALAKGQLVLFRWTPPGLGGAAAELEAGRVISTNTINALDGSAYVRLEINPAPDLDRLVELSAIEVLAPTLSASPSLLATNPIPPIPQTTPQTQIILDAFYSQLAIKDPVIVQRGNEFHAATITELTVEPVPVSEQQDAPEVLASLITIDIDLELPSDGSSNPRYLIIHFRMVDSGKLTRVATTQLSAADFIPPGIPIEGLVEPIPESVAKPSDLLLLDAMDNGVLTGGTVNITEDGKGKVQRAVDTAPFQPALRTPVTVFGNLVRATRGESVFNEVLGSGDASQAFQAFTLGNKPLTYLNDPSAPNGRRSTLEVRINGIRWKEVASFFGAGPQNEVYIVRQNDEQEAIITFGDGKTGARLPTGVDNITATYRFGGGAAKPPAGAIGQLAKPAEGLRRVVNPVAAGGGADPDRPEDFRRNAPNSALLLGRAVSVPDFEALAREFGGVINAHVEWAWDEASQSAAVKVSFISDGGDIAQALRAFLIGQADPIRRSLPRRRRHTRPSSSSIWKSTRGSVRRSSSSRSSRCSRIQTPVSWRWETSRLGGRSFAAGSLMRCSQSKARARCAP